MGAERARPNTCASCGRSWIEGAPAPRGRSSCPRCGRPISARERQAREDHLRTVRLLRRAARKIGQLMRDMVRCHLPAPLTDPRQLALTRRPPCGALVFGHRIREHLQEVHHLISAPPDAFQPVKAPPPEEDDDDSD